MTRPSFFGGVLLASASAGAIVVLPPALLFTAAEQRDRWGTIEALPLVLLLATFIGFVVSLLPNLLGTGLLLWLGRRYRWMRNPVVWALSGGAIGALIGLPFDLDRGIPGLAVVFAMAGVPCALICRWGTRWAD